MGLLFLGMKMDKNNQKEIIKMKNKMDFGLNGMKMDSWMQATVALR